MIGNEPKPSFQKQSVRQEQNFEDYLDRKIAKSPQNTNFALKKLDTKFLMSKPNPNITLDLSHADI